VTKVSGRWSGSGRTNVVGLALFVALAAAGAVTWLWDHQVWWPVAGLGLGLVLMRSPQIGLQWERGVVLRLGRFTGLRGPGLFWIVPFIDSVSAWIDQRIITTTFAAEQTLTSDTVPVNVDAVLF